MESLCHHFETCEAPAPVSEAMTSREGQSSMIERNEVGSDMEFTLGQIVLNCKANVSCDSKAPAGLNCPMGIDSAKSKFLQEFAARVKEARERRPYTQEEIADLLGIPQDKYKHYEKRSMLPHHLIHRFCLLCGVDEAWLYTAHGLAPAGAERLVEIPKARRRKIRSKAA